MDIEEKLTDKVGPLPVWAWGLVLGGIAVGFMWLNRNDTSASDGATYDASGFADAGLSGSGSGGGGATNQVPATVPKPTKVKTNAQWLSLGVAYLAGKGHSPLKAQRALSRYLDSKQLSLAQQAMVKSVIETYGLPPKVPDLVGTIGDPGNGDGDGGGNGNGNGGGGNGGGNAQHPQTNISWKASGMNYLISKGHGKTVSNMALDKYLKRKKLTPNQTHLVDIVVAKFGQPPEGRGKDAPATRADASVGSVPGTVAPTVPTPTPGGASFSSGGGPRDPIPSGGSTSVPNPPPVRSPTVVSDPVPGFSSAGGPRVR